MYKVLITHSLPYKGVELLYENFHVIIPECGMIDGVLLDEHLKDCDALLCTYAFKVTKRVIDKAHNLKIIANFGIGCDNIMWIMLNQKEYVLQIHQEWLQSIRRNSP